MAKAKKYYAYSVPSEGAYGVTDDWEVCKAIVSGRSDARYKGFSTEKEAREWLEAGADYAGKWYAYFVPETGQAGVVRSWNETEAIVRGKEGARYKGFLNEGDARQWLAAGAKHEPKPKKELRPGIYFDAGTGRGHGVEISVTDEHGKDLLGEVIAKEYINRHGKHLLAAGKTNNYGEMLACRYALELAMRREAHAVFGDSKLIIDYWSKGRIKKDGIDPETRTLAFEVKRARDAFEERGGVLERVSGDDNPADLGFHRS